MLLKALPSLAVGKNIKTYSQLYVDLHLGTLNLGLLIQMNKLVESNSLEWEEIFQSVVVAQRSDYKTDVPVYLRVRAD